MEIFVRVSEPTPTAVETETGMTVVRGVHALAGLGLIPSASAVRASPCTICRADGPPGDAGLQGASNRLSGEAEQEWARRQARFWAALGADPETGDGPWLTSFELRVASGGAKGPGGKGAGEIGLWVKAFDPEREAAEASVRSLARLAAMLWPPEWEARPICAQAEFEEGWRAEAVQWLAEVRRAEGFVVRAVEREVREGDYWLSDWSPTPAGMMEVWTLLRRLPAGVWVSVGVRPTQVFEAEERALGELWAEARRMAQGKTPAEQPYGEWQASRWLERMKRWLPNAFLVRLRVGGEPEAGRPVAQALAGALMDPGGLSGGGAAVVVTPDSPEAWEAARFNWEWAEFQPWGEDQAQPAWGRLRYLCDVGEVGILGGVWG